MIGILTEKPSAKRNFMKAFGGERGLINGKEFVIVNALGHLYQLRDPKEQVRGEMKDKYSNWSLSNLPWSHEDLEWKYKVSKGGQRYLRDIKNALSKCDEIVIATDVDPTGEGDLLAAEILFGQKLHKKKLTRMDFVDESTRSLKKAFKERRSIPNLADDPNYQKALFRSRWDFLSMQFTRIASNVSPIEGVIRQGRLKSSMVHLVGEQLKLHDDYEAIPYFQNRFIDEFGVVYTSPNEEKYGREEDVPGEYKNSKVITDSKELNSTPPPRLVDLARLSSMLAPKGYSSAEVQATYQKMYQEEYLSYPRTEDKNITHEQFKEMLPLIGKIAEVVGVNVKELTQREPRPTHVKDTGSHGANRPGMKVPIDLKSLSRFGRSAVPIYTLLAKNFLGMFAEDYIYEHQKGHIKDYPDFKGTANIPRSLGWKKIFKSDDEDDISEGGSGLGELGEPYVHKGFPPRPITPTQGWLMRQLEKYSVGSGSTRNSTFTEITNQKTKYPLMKSERGKLSLSTHGIISHQLLAGTKIGDVATSERVLEVMSKIGDGDVDLANRELTRIEDLIRHDLKVMRFNSKDLEIPSHLARNHKKIDREIMKTESGKNASFKTEWGGHKFTDEEIKKLSLGETITIHGLRNKRGRSYSAKGNIQKQTFNKNTFWGFKMTEYIEDK